MILPTREGTATIDDHAKELYMKLPFINGSDTTVLVPGLWWAPHFDEAYIRRLREGQVSALIATQICWYYDTAPEVLKRISFLYEFLAAHKNTIRIIESVRDLDAAMTNGHIGIIMQFHNTLMIENIGYLELFHKLGLRVMQLTYLEGNSVADGSAERRDAGLTSYGLRVIELMNELGIILDLAHVGPKSFFEALKATTSIPIVSHSCSRAICDRPRNLRDDQIVALAERGGVIGIMAKPFSLKTNALQGATVSDYVDHVEHVADLAGVDHVGIGLENGNGRTENEIDLLRLYHSDVSGAIMPGIRPNFETFYSVKGLTDPLTAKLNIVRELVRRGYSDSEIGKILGGNFLRIFRNVWKL